MNRLSKTRVTRLLLAGFMGITALVEATLEGALGRNWTVEPESLDQALSVDHDSRLLARELLPEIAAKAS